MTMADKIVLLNAGRVEQFSPPEELYARPATVFVAGFIGTPPMNLLPLDNPEVLQWARANIADFLPEGTLDQLVLGVRPEKISLSDTGLAASVLSLEYLGADSLIACKIGTRELIVRQSGRVKLAAGDRIHLNWPQAESHFFEAGSGLRHIG